MNSVEVETPSFFVYCKMPKLRLRNINRFFTYFTSLAFDRERCGTYLIGISKDVRQAYMRFLRLMECYNIGKNAQFQKRQCIFISKPIIALKRRLLVILKSCRHPFHIDNRQMICRPIIILGQVKLGLYSGQGSIRWRLWFLTLITANPIYF